MLIKRTVLGGCALLGMLLVGEPVRSAEPLEVKPLVYQAGANATTLDNGSGAVVEQVQWRHGHGHHHGHHHHGGWGGRSRWSVGFGYGGASGYYGRGYHPGYYSHYSQPYYGYGSYYPRNYGYNYSYYSPSVSIGIGGPGYSAYYGGYPYYGSYGYCH